ncbi:MAG: non-canonical purine NTP pyrophosphatase, partial [Bacteroidaceae bacterium]|nr:non-canonical purine NTP pyrophosphatase [Bacteroidaceae bacterium]
MKKLVIATNNAHKLDEIRAILGHQLELLSLKDIHCDVDIPETADTLEGNASQKAHFIYDNYGINCFADDTGLEVEALNGEPGVHTARYATEGHDTDANVRKLLHELEGKKNRKARFRTIVSLIEDGVEHQFEGIVNGIITTEKRGTNGFGYDPVF